MTTLLSRLPVVALFLFIVVACGDSFEAPHDGAARSDAALPADAAPPNDTHVIDAASDAPPVIDMDHDGHPADTDCDDGDPSVWQNLPYSFRDADGDGHTVASPGAVCSGASLPPGYSMTPGEPDCDDADPTIFTVVTGFLDADGDGFGDDLATLFCTAGSLPAGFAATNGDCAPADPARWADLSYSFRDADGDGAAIVQDGTVCSGAALPPGYLVSAPEGRPLDCDDANPAVSIALTVFADVDGDGFGAGPSQVVCTAGSPPPGFVMAGTDCDDGDSAVWVPLVYTAVDFDGDGVTAPALGTRCTAGALLPPYYAAPRGSDCDDTDPAISVALTIFADADLDGFGAGPGQLVCTSGSPPAGFSTSGTDCDDGDAARWALLAYQAIDADADGITVPATGQLCTNGTLPPPFLATANGNDCDDEDPTVTHLAVLYPDQDGDGVGASPRQVLCIGATIPEGFARGGYDDDDTDPDVIETEDSDDLVELLLLDS